MHLNFLFSPTEKPEFCLGIVYDYGPLWDIRWRPSGAWDTSSTQVFLTCESCIQPENVSCRFYRLDVSLSSSSIKPVGFIKFSSLIHLYRVMNCAVLEYLHWHVLTENCEFSGITEPGPRYITILLQLVLVMFTIRAAVLYCTVCTIATRRRTIIYSIQHEREYCKQFAK